MQANAKNRTVRSLSAPRVPAPARSKAKPRIEHVFIPALISVLGLACAPSRHSDVALNEDSPPNSADDDTTDSATSSAQDAGFDARSDSLENDASGERFAGLGGGAIDADMRPTSSDLDGGAASDAGPVAVEDGGAPLEADRSARGSNGRRLLTQLASGRGFSCGLTTDRKVLCWGENSYGVLGRSDYREAERVPEPHYVQGLPDPIVALAAATFTTCAIDTKQVLRCWGYRTGNLLDLGEDPSVQGTFTPTIPAAAPARVSYVSMGHDRNGAWIDATEGKVDYWDSDGNVVRAPQLDGVLQTTSSGSNWCALTGARGVKCWGRGAFGVFGNGVANQSASLEPIQASGLLAGVREIRGGPNYACAILNATGGIKCWGIAAQIAQAQTAFEPVDLPGLTTGVEGLDCSMFAACAIMNNEVWCWGKNVNFVLGTEANPTAPQGPRAVAGITGAPQVVSVGYDHACVALKEGGAQCWGASVAAGQDFAKASRTPTFIPGL